MPTSINTNKERKALQKVETQTKCSSSPTNKAQGPNIKIQNKTKPKKEKRKKERFSLVKFSLICFCDEWFWNANSGFHRSQWAKKTFPTHVHPCVGFVAIHALTTSFYGFSYLLTLSLSLSSTKASLSVSPSRLRYHVCCHYVLLILFDPKKNV